MKITTSSLKLFKNTCRRYPKLIFFAVISTITLFSLMFIYIYALVSFTYSYKSSTGSKVISVNKNSALNFDKMLKESMEYINKEMDVILELEDRHTQNNSFRKLDPYPLPIVPIRMTLNTAVFKYSTQNGKNTVLKRIIWDPKSKVNEDVVCESLKNKHENIIDCYMSTRMNRVVNGEKQTLIWIFFEYMDVKITEKNVFRDEDTIRAILIDALKGLKYLHDNRLAHLDFKIMNIMGKTRRDGSIVYKLIDFGFTQPILEDNDKYDENAMKEIRGKNYGTFPFKAPEVMRSSLHGFKSDVWSLGATAWYLSIGKIPFYKSKGQKDMESYRMFAGLMKKSLEDHKRFKFKRQTSPELRDFIISCMKLDYENRPSVNELLEHPFILNERIILEEDESDDYLSLIK
ncbi:PAKG [Hepatospora eriocheir]|uniref:PAKG n=1 Tax=Hepatospora eriocheir TaxID=1081669 RepID=A0A1X0Q8Q9_9MICR|nr:PAKG [Hepatospora eriocheir]